MIPNAAQIRQWESFKTVAKRADLEIRATGLEVQNLALAVQFAKSKNIPINVDMPQIIAQTQDIAKINKRLKEAIIGVEVEDLGLRFSNNDIDIMAPAGASPDMVNKYELGWIVIAVGIVIGMSIIAYMAALRQQNSELHAKVSVLVDETDTMLCADPNSDLCKEWTETKQRERFLERQNLIDSLTQDAAGLPDAVVKIGGALTGVLIPIAIIAIAWAWSKSK